MDPGHEATEELIARLEKDITAVYRQAVEEVRKKCDDYFRRFAIKDETWRRWVREGKETEEAYRKWRQGQMMAGQRWKDMLDKLSTELHNANLTARRMVEVSKAEIYAENHNYAFFEIEKGLGVGTGYTLYDYSTVSRILLENPELLPEPGPEMQKIFEDWDKYTRGKPVSLSDERKEAFDRLLKEGKDIRWQQGQLNSVMLQGILQGESIPNLSKRIAETMGEVNHKATIRYARTAATGAQNAGRMDAYRRAEDMGIEMEKEWIATLDMRTRHEHRLLDGQKRPNSVPFEVEGERIMYPGDPTAPAHLIWNCRCTTRAVVQGWESMSKPGRSLDALEEGMSYDDWKESKREISHPITKQEDIAAAMRRKYINEYRRK